MGDKKSRNGKRSHFVAAAHETLQPSTDKRHVGCHVRADGGGKVGFLVPRQQVSGKGHRQHQREEHAARNPEKFPATFVSAVEVSLRQMKKHNDDDSA